ncbi:MAG: heterocyst differentiation protein HetZ [Coleofasciculaceae cyanobacterium SM2_1_6]|nr:heterocyst differentiation protein HetZ [Coleofasciculaceae cyanobacterium SM2_1_6]
MGEFCQAVEDIHQLLQKELQQYTKAKEANCSEVAGRFTKEVERICEMSQRIQASGEVEMWAVKLARHRLTQCLRYYQLGSRRGRVELHSTLSAIIYRYINVPQSPTSYQVRLQLMEDFLQGFYGEATKVFREQNQLDSRYVPRTLLELAEYMAFVERYAKRRIPLPGRRSQQLIILRAQTFSQQQPPEASIDMEQAAGGATGESDNPSHDSTVQQVRESMVSNDTDPLSGNLRQSVIDELLKYLEEQGQKECGDYLVLRLQDLPTNEIESILGLTPRQRDYLQQRFKYHLIRFALSHGWELVHQWLEADLERNLGLTSQEWQTFQGQLEPRQQEILRLKKQGAKDPEILQTMGITANQLQNAWFKVLDIAWKIRNSTLSGSKLSSHE